MSEEQTFSDLIQRVRAGDEAAAALLVSRYEPAIRRAVRIRLTDPRLGRVLDSMDICQSVLASFFVRAALGQYELNTPDELLHLLTTMARHKLADQVDREHAQCRDQRRVEGKSAEEQEIAAADASPSKQVSAREMLEQVERRLSPEERQVAHLRAQGMEWSDIAAQVGGSAEALRKRLTRATDRVAQELGID